MTNALSHSSSDTILRDADHLFLFTPRVFSSLSPSLPFYQHLSLSTGFGWLNDPLLLEVQNILYVVQNKSANGTVIPWTSAVPGASFNWTSVEETRRRRSPDKLKTGKKNPNQVSGIL